LRLRFHYPEIGLVWVETRGDLEAVLGIDRVLEAERDHWLAREIRLLQARVLRRMDVTSRSFFARIDEGSAFAGSLLELSLASDRSYALEDEQKRVAVAVSPMNAYAFPMWNGLTRLEARCTGHLERLQNILSRTAPIPITEASELGL